MTRNTPRFDKNDNLVVTKAFEKNARIYGTPEYKMWREIKSDNPNCVMVTKKIKKNPNKKTNKNLTFKNIELYISIQDNSEELFKEYENVRAISKLQKSPYNFIVDWFKKKFEGYDSYEQFFKNIEENKNSKTTDDDMFEECA